MPWLIALILVAGGLCLAGLAMRAQAPDGQGPVTVAKVSNASNAEIERMLRKIETSPAPEPKMGAMCYRVSMPEPITEYVCPVCGEHLYEFPYKNAGCALLYCLSHHEGGGGLF